VASGMVPMAHATDGGGSIRIPASCCGLFGLKPTRARNPMGPDAGEGWGGASVGHAVTWSVRDSAALLDATSGPDVGDPYWAPPPAGPFLGEVGRAPRPLRIALTTTPWFDAPVDGECAAAARAAAHLCESLGHNVEEARPEIETEAWRHATRVIVAANVTSSLETRAAALGRPLAEGDVERMTWERVVDARRMSAADYARSIHTVHRVGRQVARFFQRYDVLVSPTMCKPPHPLGVLDMSTSDPDAYLAAVFASIGFTSLFNSSGNPAMSVPLATSRAGLPSGCSSPDASATRPRCSVSAPSSRPPSPGRNAALPSSLGIRLGSGQQAVQRRGEVGDEGGFEDDVDRAEPLHRFGILGADVTRGQHDRDAGADLADLPRELDPRETRHREVGHEHVELVRS
jgi:amidase